MPVLPFRPEGFTKWFKLVIREGSITIGRLIEVVQERYGLTITTLGSELASAAEITKPLYPGSKTALVVDVAAKKLGAQLPNLLDPTRGYLVLESTAENADGVEVEMPRIVYYWK